jgi:hypothetical protein
LRRRVLALEAEIAGSDGILAHTLGLGIPRIFVIEEEYAVMLRRAEVEFVRRLIADLEAGELWPDAAILQALAAQQGERGGGVV